MEQLLVQPSIIVAYKLDPRYQSCGDRLNIQTFDPIIEKEIIELSGEENWDITLLELAEYVGKTGGFASTRRDAIQKPVNWWNLMKWRLVI